VESAQAERAEADIPLAVVYLDEPAEFLAKGLTKVDPLCYQHNNRPGKQLGHQPTAEAEPGAVAKRPLFVAFSS
jgi:hypothetical protein